MSFEYCENCDSTFDPEDNDHFEICPDYRESKHEEYIDNLIDNERGK